MMKKSIIILLLLVCSVFAQDETSVNNRPPSIYSTANLISVTLGGSFVVNGTFQASTTERADQFVTRIFNLYKLNAAIPENNVPERKEGVLRNSQYREVKEYALRDITLKRKTGEIIKLDLAKFRLTGDFQYNPYLKNEDVIIFPAFDNSRNFIAVDGAVNKPIKFQFVEGDRLSDALLFAQGVSASYENVTQAEVVRLSYSGDKEEVIKVNLNSDVPLKVGDRIRVLADETHRKDYRVLVLGEVNQPGYIYIPKNGVNLKDAIAKAGGFKPTADLTYSELLRGTDAQTLYKKNYFSKSFEQDRYNNQRTELPLENDLLLEKALMFRMAHFIEEDSVYFKVDDRIRNYHPSGLVDFTQLKDENSESANFPVRDGDVILVPQVSNLVYVFGQVANPGFIQLSEGKDLDYYLQKSGGLGMDAKEKENIMLIKGKSREWIANKEGSKLIPQSGDFIWVPKKTPRTFDFYLWRVSTYAGVVGSIATLVLLLVQFGK